MGINFHFLFASLGPVEGMKCTRISEPEDPESWQDNYICVPKNSPYDFMWSDSGSIENGHIGCLKIDEPTETGKYWRDNYLCATRS